MNKKKIAALTALFAALTTLTAADPWVDNVQISKTNPEVGEKVQITASASDSGTITWLQARRDGGNWDSRYCNRLATCSNTDDPWEFTFQNPGAYNIEIRAKNSDTTDPEGEVVTRTIQVVSEGSGGLQGIPVSLEKVTATDFRLSSGEETQLHAHVKNSNQDYGKPVKVSWYAIDGSYPSSLGSRVQTVNSGSTETLAPRTLNWEDLKSKGLEVGEEYSVKADLYYDSDGDGSFDSSEEISSMQADRKLVINRHSGTEGLSIESVSATRSDLSEGESTHLKAEVRNPVGYPKDVTIKWYTQGNDYSTFLGEDQETVQDNDKGEFESGFLSWQSLKEKGLETGKNYQFKAKLFSEGQEKDSMIASSSLRLQARGDNEGSNRYSFDITVVNSNGEGLENADVRVYSDEYGYGSTRNTPASGEVTFRNLRPRYHSVEVSCSPNGISEIQQNSFIEVEESGFNEKEVEVLTTVDYCGETDDGDTGDGGDDGDDGEINSPPDASLDVRTVFNGDGYKRVEFDASGSSDPDGSIYKWSFDLDGDGSYTDETVYSGGVVEKTFFSDFSGEVGVEVTDNDDAEDTARRYLNVDVDDRGVGDDDEDPDAVLDVRPQRSEVGATVTFDATESTDNRGIDYYRFDFDGDGIYERRDSDGIYRRSFSTTFSGDARVQVVDDSGNSDTARDFYERYRRDEEPGDGSIRVNVRDRYGDLKNAYVSIFNGPDSNSDYTDSSGNAYLKNLQEGSYDLKVRCAGETGRIYNVEVNGGERTFEEKVFSGNLPNDCSEDDGGVNERPQVDLIEPTGSGLGSNPVYRWEIADDQSYMESVELVVDDDSNPFTNPVYRFDDVINNVPTRANRERSFSQPTYLDLELGNRYYWGIKADDGEKSSRKTESFKTRSDDTVEEDGGLEITVRDDAGDQMDNARVYIQNGVDRSGKTAGNGKVSFSGISPGRYDIRVRCEGSNYFKNNLRVRSGETSRPTVYLTGLFSSNNYCGETGEEDNGRLTVNARDSNGNSLDARVSLDSSLRTGFTGNDGRVVFENLPIREFDVRVSKADYETAYRSVDLEEDRTQSITVTLRKKEEDSRPEADFSYSPVNPEAGDQVSFDGGLSSGRNIIDYSWSFGDGSRSSGRQVAHRYDESGTYPVRLTVEQQDGDQDTRIKYVSVGAAQDQCGVSEDSFYFSLEDYTIEEGDSTEAELQIFNTGSKSQNVDVKIKVGGGTVIDRTVSVPARSSRTVRTGVSPDRDSFVTAEVSASGEPCGFKDFQDLNKELVVLQDSDDEEASLDVNVDSEDGYVRNARVEVEGPEDRVRFTDRYGEAGFSLQAGRYDVEVSHPRYGTEEKSIRLREGDNEELRFDLEREESEDGTLEVNVVDRDGDEIEDARVRVENGNRKTEYTDSRGEARFSLQADDYDIEVTHPDYDDTARSSVEIEEEEFHSRTLRLYDDERDRRGLEIVSTDYPSSVCRGDTLSVDYRVRNYQGYDESAQTTASGLGGIIVTNTYVVDSRESVSGTLRFTNVEGSGQEEFDIRVENGTSDRVTRTVEVRDCGVSEPQEPADPDSISMKLSYPVAPNRALVGETVKVTGFVDGVNKRTQVRIDIDGDEKARVSTQPDGYYQTYIRVDSPGMKTVRARAAGESASRQIDVLPTATVSSIEAPRSVFEGESFEVCSQVDSQIEAGVFFYEDGRLLERENTRGETCFEVNAEEPGTHVYEVRAATPGTSSSSTVSVEVMETEVQARSFPDQIASVESGSGMVKVDLYNSNSEMTRYDLNLEGLPRTWLSQSSKQVILSPGESETVYFYLTPRDEGSYEPEIVVEADNSEVYRQEVDLETGGQNEPRRKSFLETFRDFFL